MKDYEKILEKLKDMFTENDVEAAVVSADGEEGIGRILLTRHRSFGSIANTAAGEYYFLSGEGGDYGVFTTRITLLSDIREESLPYLAVEITNQNARLPLGSFAWDPFENTIYYSLKVPVPATLSEKELTEEADSAVALSMTMAEHYCTDMLKLANAGGIA
ncbi:MAG: hypothetical protein J6N76_08705 [Lachnospiraceae bacterium]|nr:hypothetical protein [Lachnospiraceae bacterium]